ncbi:hypothetical protein MGN70_010011 [Eutypa lata]|nr:hypothetical protein MGN70_010011 [Eutypa lata]
MKGVKTTGQSRSYARLYGPQTENAAIVSQLIRLGAVIIGKTKCTQFASSDQPTADWVDYHCPWNPRGDGYLSPRGSSSGTCVALAGGIDTYGTVCRDVELFRDSTRLLFEVPDSPGLEFHDRAPKILFPSDYWNQYPEGPMKECMESAVGKLERCVGIQRTTIDLADKWLKDNPSGDSVPISTYLQDTFMTLLWSGYYENFRQFRSDYQNAFGTHPYVHPVIQHCWARGSSITTQEIERAQQRKEVYKTWLRNEVFDGDGFKTVMVFPFTELTPFYRDAYRKDPESQSSDYNWIEREDHQSSLAGIPCIVLPGKKYSV